MDKSTVWHNNFPTVVKPGNETHESFPYPAQTDVQLIERVLTTGDGLAFEQLFDRYKRFVAVIARRYFYQPDEVEEIIQITFSKIYFQLEHFHGNQNSSMAGWIGKITVNSSLDFIKSQKRKRETLDCDIPVDDRLKISIDYKNFESNVEKQLIDRNLAKKLLSELETEDRVLLQMLYVEELSIQEISNSLSWTSSKVKIRAYRARLLLRKILKKI